MTLPNIPQPGNRGKIMSARIRCRDKSTIAINYPQHEAQAIRDLAASIRLKCGTRPSLSLLSRRALEIYLSVFPQAIERETAVLNRMVTPVPKPRPSTGRQRPSNESPAHPQ